MPADYSKLWKLLIDKKINKTQLKELAHISTNAVAKKERTNLFLWKHSKKYAVH